MRDVIEMAREASDPDKVDPWRDGFWILTQEELERFASLVRADALADHSERPLDMVAEQALDKMADNARELGLDYEPDGMHHNKPQKRPQNCGTGYCSCIECVMEPAQEPAPLRDAIVGNLVREGINKHKARELADHFINLTNAQQEPVAYLCENAVGHKYFRWKKPSSTYKPIALYTSPPAQRTWVGLTSEELDEMFSKTLKGKKLVNWVARAIEAKLREKNNG